MNTTTDQTKTSAWEGFMPGLWQKEVNVRDFIQQNYKPYEGDHAFLLEGGVFSKQYLFDFIDTKRDEVADERKRPTPSEFYKYYDV